MKIVKTSPFTGRQNTMDLPITSEQIERWQNGELIQNAFPNLTPDEREFLMTGITPEDWNGIFGTEE